MHITKKGEYGLKALLALAQKYPDQTLSLREISEQEKLPAKFLEQIMIALRQSNFVQSSQGKHGGYVLSRPPSKISLGEIIRAIDGPLAPLETGAEIRKKVQRGDRHSGLYATLLDVRNATCAILDHTTLSDVWEKTSELSRKKNSMYYI